MSPDSLASLSPSVPPSPARSTAEPDTDRELPSRQPSPRTPIREDPARKVLADENATVQELCEVLQLQVEKYKRLSEYLLSMTERHEIGRAHV